ncbi:GGDEF domain-containing protein [Carbonactinospora thermoautotrophica]|nr:GGDEF domain-containing protein [Carbonactinospora thermoautotrophica]
MSQAPGGTIGEEPVRGGAVVRDRLRAVADLAQTLATVRGVESVIEQAASQLRRALDAASVSLVVGERDGVPLRAAAGDDLAKYDNVVDSNSAHDSWRPAAFHAEAGTPSRAPYCDLPQPARPLDDLGTSPAGCDPQIRRERRNLIVVPIVVGGHTVGQFQATRRPDQAAFDAEDLVFAHALAAQVAAAVAHAEQVERLERLAFQDPLTGLANRRAIDERLALAIAGHRRHGGVVSLIVCDVNGLKQLNDEQGHEAGDRLLMDFARLLAEASAELPGSLAARLGGDEFCVLVEEHDADDAVRLAEEVCRRALALPGGQGVACGVASTGDPVGPVTTAQRLFRLADAAQYRAKRAGATMPVVAGRGAAPDVTVRLVEEEPSRYRSGDRRRFRGAAHVDPGQLLMSVLRELEGAEDPGTRLERVAQVTARSLGAQAWRLSYVPSDGQLLHLVGYGTSTAAADAGHLPASLEQRAANLDDYPARAAAVRGGSYTAELGAADNDPTEEAVLVRGGHHGVLAAGVTEPDGGGWLVEVFTGQESAPVHGLGPVLHALLAVAVAGPDHA